MSRMRFAFTVAGASLAAGAAGCALGMLLAPASGAELRRRITSDARHQFKSMGRNWERMVDRAAERAKEEFKRRTLCAS
jgi:gas vesicle protein